MTGQIAEVQYGVLHIVLPACEDRSVRPNTTIHADGITPVPYTVRSTPADNEILMTGSITHDPSPPSLPLFREITQRSHSYNDRRDSTTTVMPTLNHSCCPPDTFRSVLSTHRFMHLVHVCICLLHVLVRANSCRFGARGHDAPFITPEMLLRSSL